MDGYIWVLLSWLSTSNSGSRVTAAQEFELALIHKPDKRATSGNYTHMELSSRSAVTV